MCRRGLSWLGLERFHAGTLFFFYFLSLCLPIWLLFSLFLLLLFLDLACAEYTQLCLCVSHTQTHTSMQVCTFSHKQTSVSRLCSHWAHAWIFLNSCAFSPQHTGSLWNFCLMALAQFNWHVKSDCMVSEYTEKLLPVRRIKNENKKVNRTLHDHFWGSRL